VPPLQEPPLPGDLVLDLKARVDAVLGSERPKHGESEGVDGGYLGTVEVLKCQLERPRCRNALRQRALELAADAVAKFRCCLFCERDSYQLFDRTPRQYKGHIAVD